ncbi:ferroxidase, multicopper oxidase [Rhizoctonia solani AG-1 IA]|uniref:Ferroxidase, multicopper oxidase n=1 Tax=Thanatephorus cucumeris (strain AG1-IA) TaxID=983506 RepID=L8WX97_THACA|nr:ferroxidase, multicopper oxidase [Rhizoctonia solani AG-1 IA]
MPVSISNLRSNPKTSTYENGPVPQARRPHRSYSLVLFTMRLLEAVLLAYSTSLSSVLAATHEIWWDITYLNANPDGLHERRVIGINGTWPPPIELSSNDTLVVHAHNSLDVPTSLHHHGMFFPNRTYFDGAVGVSQCGIPPGESFTYEVPVFESAQWGTYWIHAHASGQYVDGLRGPVVVHHKDAAGESLEAHRSSYDDEMTVVLADWYHDEHSVNNAKFLSRWNPGGAEPVPESSLIYFTANGTNIPGFNENTTLNFVPGKTYRLRVINTSALAMFYFWIDGHEMRIIEVDGVSDSKPQDDSALMSMQTDVVEAPTPLLTLTVAQHITSSITYSADAPMAPEQTMDDYDSMPWDTTFKPLEPMTLPNPTKELELGVFFDTMDNGINRGMFNSMLPRCVKASSNNTPDVTWNVPIVPSTISALTMGEDASVANVYGPNAEVLQYGEIVQMTVVNWDDGKHPLSDDVTSDDPAVNPPFDNNQVNPIWRDTVQIEGGGSVTIRWQAWVFLEAPNVMQQWTKPPQYYFDQCKMLGVPISGNAAGHNSTTDLSGLTIGPFPQKLGWNAKGIGAMTGCVLSALLGIATVIWYSTGPGKDAGDD